MRHTRWYTERSVRSAALLLASLLSFTIGAVSGCGQMEGPGKGTTSPLSTPIAASSSPISGGASRLSPSSIDETRAGKKGAADAGFLCPPTPPPLIADASTYVPHLPPTWARDLASGNCCYYDDATLAPEGWARFDTQSDCEGSCRCADVAPANPDDANAPAELQAELRKITRESISLECFCGAGFTCYHTLEEAKATLCGSDGGPFLAGAVAKRSGCGLVELEYSGGYVGGSWVFDAATGALVGAETFSDEEYPPCLSFTTRGGRAFACSDAITECQLCGDATAILDHPADNCP